LKKKNAELRRANDILKIASARSAAVLADPAGPHKTNARGFGRLRIEIRGPMMKPQVTGRQRAQGRLARDLPMSSAAAD
jgi:hypothetical protein